MWIGDSKVKAKLRLGKISSSKFCVLVEKSPFAMDDQANRPHRKTKEKKKHTGGQYYPFEASRADVTKPILRLLGMPTLDDCKSRQRDLMMYVESSLRARFLTSTGQREKASCSTRRSAPGGGSSDRRRCRWTAWRKSTPASFDPYLHSTGR